jgi:hypothetical protein
MQFGKKFEEKADMAALKLATSKMKSAGSAKMMAKESASVGEDLTCPNCGFSAPEDQFVEKEPTEAEYEDGEE